MEEDWEEEEQLVVAELSGMIDSDVLCKPGGMCKIVGMSSEQPMVQVGRYVFTGEYEDALGTCVILEEQKKSDPSPVLKYKCHTTKKLMLQRTFLSERKEGEASSGGIELLSLNEGEMCGRASTVCHFALESTDTHGRNAGEDSDKSDTENTQTLLSSVLEDSVPGETRDPSTH